MILVYPKHGNGDEFTLDTDSLDLHQRAKWGQQVLKARSYAIEIAIAEYANVPDSAGLPGTVLFRRAQVRFTLGSPVTESTGVVTSSITVDAVSLLREPEKQIAAAATVANVEIPKDLVFVDPDDGKPAPQDWEVLWAVVGPPLAGQPGLFQFRWTGQSLGTHTTGQVSGKAYELVEIGTFAFFKSYAWKLL